MRLVILLLLSVSLSGQTTKRATAKIKPMKYDTIRVQKINWRSYPSFTVITNDIKKEIIKFPEDTIIYYYMTYEMQLLLDLKAEIKELRRLIESK